MIISKPKPLEEILTALKSEPVFLIGCSECATLCHSGGEEEVLDLKKVLEEKGIVVTGWVILDPACHLLNDRRLLKPHREAIQQAECLLILACGNGVQTVAELYANKHILPGTDTLFLGEIKRATEFEKRCSLCGDCLLELFDGLCPITRCPKSMLNGPCGGSSNGKCEVNPDIECIWELIVERLKQNNRLQNLQRIQPPKDWSKSLETRRTL